jgi:hybrid cluster-associated redox disulfide protein|tara:strand:- start:175 stop:390 length:216 start_codon:yes stop_codon:yes gene_type:complete
MTKQTITRNMLIGEIVKKHPSSVEVMTDHGMQCVGCHVATWETLEQGASGHGIDVDKLVNDLNKKIEVKQK